MEQQNNYDVIIIGGSYAGLSAAMALGRSLRKVLVIDNNKPCNRQTPHSHNFITQDGKTPKQIADEAKAQVLKYLTITFIDGLVTDGNLNINGFTIVTEKEEVFAAKKLLFATGIKDIMPQIPGFAECWGISVLHCPYCHGYEVQHKKLGVSLNGEMTFETTRMISNWTDKLTLFTNGKSTLTEEQTQKLQSHDIAIVEKKITSLNHENGYIKSIVFDDGSQHSIDAVFSKSQLVQHFDLPEQLGCTLTEQGFIQVDDLQRTTVHGIYAAGDNTTMFRSVANAVAAGNKAGAMINREIIEETF